MAQFNMVPIGAENNKIGYYEYIPDVTPKRLIVCLPGQGTMGNGTTDLPKVLREGYAKEITEGRHKATKAAVIIQAQYALPHINSILLYELVLKMLEKYRLSKTSGFRLSGISRGGWGAREFMENLHKFNTVGLVVPKVLYVSTPFQYSSHPDLEIRRQEQERILKAKVQLVKGTKHMIVHGTDDLGKSADYPYAKQYYDELKVVGSGNKMYPVPFTGHEAWVWNSAFRSEFVLDWLIS